MPLVLDVAASTAAAALVLAVPGLPTILALRPRPLPALAMLTPVSLVTIALAAPLAHALGLSWSPLIPLVLGLALGVVVALVRRGLGVVRPSLCEGPAPDPSQHRRAAIVLGLVLGGAAVLVRGLHGMDGIEAISQTYDGIFHLSGVRAILDAHDASPGVVASVNLPEGRSGYYPALWHQLVSLTVMLGGQSLPLSSNVLMLIVAAVVWPLGVVALTASSTDVGPGGLFAAGALTGAVFAFPLALMTWGILLPNLLSTALLPLVVLIAAQVLGLSPPHRRMLTPLQLGVLVPGVALAVVLAHPQGIHASLVIVLPMALWATVRALAARTRVLLPLLVSLLLIALVPVAWFHLRPSRAASAWKPLADVPSGLAEGLGLSGAAVHASRPMAIAMVIAVLLLVLARRGRWLLPPLALALALYTVAAAVHDPDLRYLLTGPWYTDSFRLAAIIPVVGIPVLAVGIDRAGALAATVVDRRRRRPSARTGSADTGREDHSLVASAVAGAVVVVLLASAAVSPAARDQNGLMARYWQHPNVLSSQERAVMSHAAEVVPADAAVIADPWGGGSLFWALEGRRVVVATPGAALEGDDALLLRRLGDIGTDPAVCDAAARQDARYLFVSHETTLWHYRSPDLGPEKAAASGQATLLDRQGKVSLWRLDPCRGSDGHLELTD
ncbi:hypothetical protein DEO23_05530 [Brachybacterium endophyticum]|uniref:Uncharacterized protein n=1 Tax=Brachybacterium endophyticum TaxID=2182385 RepID=A0A2U2RKN7_9MICO|nr:DUF6541 family protein [Brachybacterium endophyticum]PWH06433.1 hypothetical protein DEO23_05530 [Brachybacterium endophyticum]